MSQVAQIPTRTSWVKRLAAQEAERIYMMMSNMLGERGQAIARLEAGILDLLNEEMEKRVA